MAVKDRPDKADDSCMTVEDVASQRAIRFVRNLRARAERNAKLNIPLAPIDKRYVLEGITGGSKRTGEWTNGTLEALGGKSLLALDGYDHQSFFDNILFLPPLIKYLNGRQFDQKNVVLVDILEGEGGNVRLLLEWKFNECHLTGNGGSGEEWEEARAIMEVPNDDALQALVTACKQMIDFVVCRKAFDAEVHKELQKLGIDPDSVATRKAELFAINGVDGESLSATEEGFRQRQAELLIEAGIDPQTLQSQIDVVVGRVRDRFLNLAGEGKENVVKV